MKVLITGICGFVGTSLLRSIRESGLNWDIIGIDNLSRRGSELNVARLINEGVRFYHADLRCQSDIDSLPRVDWIVDAAANPSVLAGTDGKSSTRQVIENNLFGTVNIVEKCRRDQAGLILLSTSRVYSISRLSEVPVKSYNDAFQLDCNGQLPIGLTQSGILETFSTEAPISLYGATKLASELLALEYGDLGEFPVWINRCGVMAGPGQFGRPDQGIFSYWINSYVRRKPLRYIGFGGNGFQVRDCLHPRDLTSLIAKQIVSPSHANIPRIINVSGGVASAMSLQQLTNWCSERFGEHHVSSDETMREYDLPWVVLSHELASKHWNWQPTTSVEQILEEIAAHAMENPTWLEITA